MVEVLLVDTFRGSTGISVVVPPLVDTPKACWDISADVILRADRQRAGWDSFVDADRRVDTGSGWKGRNCHLRTARREALQVLLLLDVQTLARMLPLAATKVPWVACPSPKGR